MITGYSSAASSEVPAGSEQCSPSQSPGGRYNPGAYPSAIKLLVSNNVAGSIIGRAGQTIMDLQTQSSARIKLSQTGDFYPGTQDRVCLVQGQLENVKTAVTLLVDRLYKLQEQQHQVGKQQHTLMQQKLLQRMLEDQTGKEEERDEKLQIKPKKRFTMQYTTKAMNGSSVSDKECLAPQKGSTK